VVYPFFTTFAVPYQGCAKGSPKKKKAERSNPLKNKIFSKKWLKDVKELMKRLDKV